MEKEIRDYLLKKIAKTYLSPQVVDRTIEKLKVAGLIDDRKFVDLYVKNSLAIKAKVRRQLRQELLAKGISQDLIDDDFSHSPIDEERLATDLLRKNGGSFLLFLFKRD
ncbi:MAG: RecX family transcriptional regulator [Patescibacteria group bacterium]|nr:RecX family transcriptional regulator [Patescibacteria group bacterium]